MFTLRLMAVSIVGLLCGAGGAVLLGADMRKDPQVIERAYNDQRGVTARFNSNLLVRINRELGADFNVEQFSHHAFYDSAAGRIEMHLISRRAQSVHIDGEAFFFQPGESIRTEYSHKYSPRSICQLAEASGLESRRVWIDERHYFSVNYLAVKAQVAC